MWRDHHQRGEDEVSETVESVFGVDDGKEHGAVSCVRSSDSVLRHDLCERPDVLDNR